MMKKVTKAVIPAAGLGTRVLPATKAMPKGMLPIVDKPAIQYIVEEAVAAGIEEKVEQVLGQKVWRIEGQQNAFWIAMDYLDVVVHIFQTELRDYYKLEELWADAPIKKYEYEL